jgi:hypothetical protein
VPDNAGRAFAVLVVFQDLFIGAFFSGALVTVIIFCFAHLSRCGSAILSRAVVTESFSAELKEWQVSRACAAAVLLDTTYFFAASIVRAKGPIRSGLAPIYAGGRHAASIIS